MFMSLFFFFNQKTAYELRISDWSSDVCSSDLRHDQPSAPRRPYGVRPNARRHLDRIAAGRRGAGSGRTVGVDAEQRRVVTAMPRLLLNIDVPDIAAGEALDRKSTRLNSSH